jgi:integron integrase
MKLLDQVRQAIRTMHYSIRTERAYVYWVVRYIRFHGLKHPNTMGAIEVEQFLSHLAVVEHVSASTQNQALGAILFLYGRVLQIELGRLDAVRAKRPERVPLVLSTSEVKLLLKAIDDLPTTEPYGLMARLMYGSGLRLLECCRLRVKDIDLERGQLTVRQGKGDKDRVVMLPRETRDGLSWRLDWRRALHANDLARGEGRVEMPDALERKCPNADHELGWQFLFASCFDPHLSLSTHGPSLENRVHQRSVRRVGRAFSNRRARTFRMESSVPTRQ